MTQRDYGFVIKVADLLHDVGLDDEITFDAKYSTAIPQLIAPGMRGVVTVQSASDDTVLVTLEELDAHLSLACAVCGQMFGLQVVLEEPIVTKFVAPAKLTAPSEKVHDDEFVLNMKDETIDIEEFVVQAVQLHIPTIPVCAACEQAVQVDVVDVAEMDAIEKAASDEGGSVKISFVEKK